MSKILSPQLKQADFHRTCWSATPDFGAKLEDILQPAYWVHVAKQLRVRDQIEVMPVDNSWYAILMVRNTSPAGPVLAVLHRVDFGAPAAKPAASKAKPSDAAPTELYDIKFGGSDKWRVIRKSDQEILSRGHPNKEAAQEWVDQNLTEIA